MRPSPPWSKHLRPFLSSHDAKSVTTLHSRMILTHHTSSSDHGQLIASYARIGHMRSARKVFDLHHQRSVNVWNAIIIAYSRHGSSIQALTLFKVMVSKTQANPNSYTYTFALKSCAALSDIRSGNQIWCRAISQGYLHDSFVESSVLNLYAKCGQQRDVLQLFDRMPERTSLRFTMMVTSFVQKGWIAEGVEIYRRMQEEGVEENPVVMLGLIQACTELGDLRLGLSVHCYIVRIHLLDKDSSIIENSLVDMYGKIGNLHYASRIFDRITFKTMMSWSSLVYGNIHNGFSVEALHLFKNMQNSGFKPDPVSIVNALLACAEMGDLKLGKSVHGYIVRFFGVNQILGTTVIDMYSKCGALDHACAVFHRIDSKDVISWNAMIGAYGIHGHGREALSLFLQLMETNLTPTHSTFASLLLALSHSGLVEEGRHWFHYMVKNTRIQPQANHYSCIIDLLARAGELIEAFEVLESMKSEPHISIYASLLSGCCNHRELIIGKKIAKRIIELKPDDPGTYALVSNFFGAAKMWKELDDVRKAMKEAKLKKVAACSAVEVNGKLEAFMIDDKRRIQNEEIVWLLGKLDQNMRTMDYIFQSEFMLHDDHLHGVTHKQTSKTICPTSTL